MPRTFVWHPGRGPKTTEKPLPPSEGKLRIEDFRIDNVPRRIARLGDLWSPLNERRGRFDLGKVL